MRAIDRGTDGMMREQPGAWSKAGGAWAPLFVLLAALALFSIHLGRPTGDFDEYYHILGARGWLATGEPRILDGVYRRTELYTILVAGMFRLLGESFWAARLPAVVASALLAMTLFLWLRARAGSAVAWTGTFLYVTSPFTIELAQFARFYAVQSLAFFLGVIAVEEAAAPGRSPSARLGLALGAALGFVVALYLQVTTAIGLAGLFLWLACARGLPWLQGQPARRRATVLAGLALLGLLALGLLFGTGFGRAALGLYRFAPAWAASQQNAIWFYHLQLLLHYPALWPFMPVLALAALTWRPRVAFLAFTVFVVAFLAHSFAALKSMPYIAYAMPFLWTLVAIGLVALWPMGRALIRRLGAGLAGLLHLPRHARLLGRASLVFSLLFLLIADPAFVRSATMLMGVRMAPQVPLADWQAAAARLRPLVQKVDVLADTSELETLYYFGRHDLLISDSRLSEMDGKPQQFAIDERVGRPVISTPAALARLIDCYRTGLVLSSDARWRNGPYLDNAVANLLVRRATPVDLPPSWHVQAWRWDNPAAPADPAAAGCPLIGHAAAIASR